jgi:SEFIR domain
MSGAVRRQSYWDREQLKIRESKYGAVKVFISYSHDTPEHSQRVLQLANALRAHGVDVALDEGPCRTTSLWVHKELAPYYSHMGRPSIDPIRLAINPPYDHVNRCGPTLKQR